MKKAPAFLEAKTLHRTNQWSVEVVVEAAERQTIESWIPLRNRSSLKVMMD